MDDTLTGTTGKDILVGLGGDDYFYGDDGDDILFGGEGNDDRMYGGYGDDILFGGNGIDWLRGNNGDDILYGGADNDLLLGGEDDDELYGEAGDDRLVGHEGDDEMVGGGGEDTYEFSAGDGTDTITDSGGNIIFDLIGDDDYAGAIYTFVSNGAGDAVTLTVTNGGNTLNVIKFTNDPSSYRFYIGSVSSENEIPASSLILPSATEGSERNPFLATAAADSFTGSAGADWVSYAGLGSGGGQYRP